MAGWLVSAKNGRLERGDNIRRNTSLFSFVTSHAFDRQTDSIPCSAEKINATSYITKPITSFRFCRSKFHIAKLAAREDKKLSCRKETVRLLRVSFLAKFNWKTICAHRSIFNNCVVIGLQIYRIP